MDEDKNLSEKLKYIFKKYCNKKLVADTFGFKSPSSLTTWDNIKEPSIAKVHILGLQEYFKIPIEIFDDDILYDESLIDEQIKEYKESLIQKRKEEKIFESLKRHSLIPLNLYNKEIETKEQIDRVVEIYKADLLLGKDTTMNKLFQKDERLWGKLKGEFYAYMYASEIFNGDQEVHQVQTSFYDDYQVIDEHDNHGKLFMGEHQSIIVKKSPNEKNFSFILFNNKQVTYQTFRFTIISTQNGTGSGGEEMVNWGFYSKEKLSIEKAREMLGQKDRVQLKLDLDFARRIRQNFMIEYGFSAMP